MLWGVLLMAVGLWQTPAFGQVWDGGSEDWFGPWLGGPPGSGTTFPVPTTNWGCGFCTPAGPGSDAQIGTIFTPLSGFPEGVSGTVSLGSAVTVGSLELGNGAPGGLQLNPGGNLTMGGLTVGALAPVLGPNGQGTLNITGGGTLSAASIVNAGSAVLGAVTASSGAATLSGAGSQLSISGGLTLGNQGQGMLTVQSGGIVGDTFTNMGLQSSASGTATVNGAGSQWNNSSFLVVSQSGNSVLNITNGGLVSDVRPTPTQSAAVIGLDSGSGGTVDVSGSGSVWKNNGPVNVGFSGSGSLTIDSGGQVTTNILLIGSQLGSHGSVKIQSGGQLMNAGSAFVGGVADSTAKVSIDAGSWINTGPVFIGTSSGQATVSIQDGGLLTASAITVGTNGSLIVDPATVEVDGNFTLSPSGLLSLDIAGTAPGSFSQLDIMGSGFFDGIVDFDFIDGFAPHEGDTFDLINDTSGVDLSAATVEIEGLEPGFEYTAAFANGELILTALNDGVATPEPNGAWLFGCALSALLLTRGLKRSLVACRREGNASMVECDQLAK
jgi:T5SS/PEP-CTERM-associated repeat protein